MFPNFLMVTFFEILLKKQNIRFLAPIEVKILVNRLVPKDERFTRLQRRAGGMLIKMSNASAPKK
ncbi:hypothetical protein EM308_12545 [Flavobacterium gilvum]|uniref:Uncharacterized protein n=1 Tax=Flavobacterium gilvum TaxID=1492737 RepID=A0AAC9I627_9FLAO|nr:hypothetical protein EM308_12545 [Flavobacterium gilvum]